MEYLHKIQIYSILTMCFITCHHMTLQAALSRPEKVWREPERNAREGGGSEMRDDNTSSRSGMVVEEHRNGHREYAELLRRSSFLPPIFRA